jgi:hypothetical protein
MKHSLQTLDIPICLVFQEQFLLLRRNSASLRPLPVLRALI